MTSHGGSGADVPPVQVNVPNTTTRSKVPGGALASGMLGILGGGVLSGNSGSLAGVCDEPPPGQAVHIESYLL